MSHGVSAAGPAEAVEHAITGRDRRIVGAMLTTTVLVMGNVVFVTPVLPEVATEFGADQTQVQLVADALPVLLAALLLPAGALLDRYGRRRGVLAGLAIMTASLIGSAFASSAELLIFSRCVAGVGAAFAFPGTLSTITAVLPPQARDRGVAGWSGACMVGGVWALCFAGAIAQVADMRTLFLAMAGVTAACFVGVVAAMPETCIPGQNTPDLASSAAAIVGVGALALGITSIPVDGLFSNKVLLWLAVGSLGLIGFVMRSLRSSHPLLDVRIFKERRLSLGVLAIFIPFLCSQAWFFLGFQFNCWIFGWSPLEAALGIAPAALTIVPFAILGPRFAAKFGVVRLLVATLIFDAFSSALLGLAGLSQNFLVVSSATLVWGVGIGLAQAPATQLVLDALPDSAQGLASALNDLSRELAAATGIAVLGSAFNAAYRSSVQASLGQTPVGDAVAASPARGLSVGAESANPDLISSVRDAIAHGWLTSFLVAAIGILIVAVVVAYRARRHSAGTLRNTATSPV